MMMDSIKRGGVVPPDDGSHECTYLSFTLNARRLTLIFPDLALLLFFSSPPFPRFIHIFSLDSVPEIGLVGEECYGSAFKLSLLGCTLALGLSVLAGVRREKMSKERRDNL